MTSPLIAAHLVKPITPSHLFDTAMQLLAGHAPAKPNQSRRRHDTHAEDVMAAFAGARLLLVEDNDLNQEVARELLLSAGFNVDIADNGQLALEQLAKADYELVLMDIQMPVMDGLTATQLLRRDPRWATLPVIAMTANAMEQDRQQCLAAGMNDFVSKPIEPEQLWRALQRWLTPRNPVNQSGREQSAIPRTQPTDPMVPTLPGVDSEQGLSRVMGNHNVYRKLLLKFVEGQHDSLERIRQALDANDRTLAERLAHTLKGVSGNIGASALQEQAALLEKAIREQGSADEIADRLAQIDTPLQTLCHQLSMALMPPHAEASPEPAPRGIDDDIRPILEQLAQLLREDDAEALEVLDEHLSSLQQSRSHFFAPLEEAIRNYEFEQALSHVEHWIEDLAP